MPASDYTSLPSTGKLKLKGSPRPVDGFEDLQKEEEAQIEGTSSCNSDPEDESTKDGSGQRVSHQSALSKALQDEEKGLDVSGAPRSDGLDEGRKERGKTEAEKRWEEQRRKRLDDRLKREGVKSHKERVEELNKYLSGLSEHHDMPRIGPG